MHKITVGKSIPNLGENLTRGGGNAVFCPSDARACGVAARLFLAKQVAFFARVMYNII